MLFSSLWVRATILEEREKWRKKKKKSLALKKVTFLYRRGSGLGANREWVRLEGQLSPPGAGQPWWSPGRAGMLSKHVSGKENDATSPLQFFSLHTYKYIKYFCNHLCNLYGLCTLQRLLNLFGLRLIYLNAVNIPVTEFGNKYNE